MNFVWICLNAVWILISKRLKLRQNIAIGLQRQNATEEVPKLEKKSSIAKIFESGNKEVKLKYHHQSSNYLEPIIYEPKMKYKNSLNH